MTKRFVLECVVTGIVVALSVLLLNPFKFWMPSAAHLVSVAFLLASACAGGILVWRQSARDEREELHQLLEARAGYVASVVILVFAVVMQSFSHAVDPWLVISLVVIVAVRLGMALILSHTR